MTLASSSTASKNEPNKNEAQQRLIAGDDGYTPEQPSGMGALRERLRSSRLVILALQLALIVGVLAVWEFASGDAASGAIIDEFYVGNPSEAYQTILDWYRDGVLFTHVAATVEEALVGFAIGTFFGMATGFALGLSEFAHRIFSPFIVAGNSIPKLALAPLFLLWFGLGAESKIALVALITFFLIFYNTYSGVRDVDQDLVNVLRVMRASRWQIHRIVTLPSAAAWVIAGLRVSVPYSFVGAVVGEMLASREGLGYLIQRASTAFNPSAMFAAIALLLVLALVLNFGVTLIERSVLRWKAVDSGAGPGDVPIP